jgi:hypothetical protein
MPEQHSHTASHNDDSHTYAHDHEGGHEPHDHNADGVVEIWEEDDDVPVV